MKIRNQVENILKASFKARNDDKELIVIYMQKYGMDLSAEQIAIFKKMASVETIRRTRQVIQEQGHYLADPQVEEARYQKFKEVKDGIHDEDPEYLIEKQGYKVLPWGS